MITALARSLNGSTELIPSRLFLVTPPATEPLTIAEARRQILLNTSAGEPAPSVMTVALANPAVSGNVTAGAHRYMGTFVTADGETEGGDISAIVTVADASVNGQVVLTGIAIGGSLVTARKLYRTVAGGSTYFLLAPLSNNTATTYTDNIADGSLGAQAPTANTTADPELSAWIMTARLLCEADPSADGAAGGTGRALMPQVYDLKLDGFPWGYPSSLSQFDYSNIYRERQFLGGTGMRPIVVPKPPLVSVTSITYVDTNGAPQTWDPSLYTVDAPTGDFAEPGRIYPNYGTVYPVTRAQPAAVTIRFVAGYATSALVPQPIKSAMKLLIAEWYAQREAGIIMRGSSDVIPFGVDVLLGPYRVM